MIEDLASNMKLSSVCPDIAFRWKNVRQEMWDLHQKQLKVTQGLRTFSQQWDDWGQGRLKEKNGEWIICDLRKIITYAKAGESFHQYGLAIDSCFIGQDPYLSQLSYEEGELFWCEYGRLCKKNGLEWGGDWRHIDKPHCELSYGLSIHDVQILYENKGIKGVWEKCKQLSQCGTEMVKLED